MQPPFVLDPVPGRSTSPDYNLPPILEPTRPSEGMLSSGEDALALVAETLCHSLETKDRCTGDHIKRTALYAVRLATAVPGMDPERLERVRLAAILHDVGKIGVDDRILKKQSALDETEWRQMRAHPRLGVEMLGDAAKLWGAREIRDAILHHHERWDGQGYPNRLAGEQIPWIARLVAVVDAYDAMVSTRPYRKGISPRLAYAEILGLAGTQLDPEIVGVFARVFAP